MNIRQTGRERNADKAVTTEHFLKTACLFLCVTGILVGTVIRSEMRVGAGRNRTILITAHRGASRSAPENTRASVELAIAEQADYAEIDVRLTADGVPVLMHDRTLFRTTGVMNEIDKVTYEEVAGYDAGCRYAESYTGENVPCLQEILEAYGGKIKFNIELKGENNRKLAEAVVALIEEYGLEERCVVSSDSYPLLEWVKNVNARIRTGYILSRVYGEIFGYDAADFFSVKFEYVTEQLVKGAHASKKEIHVWTVNKEYEIKRMQALGVDNIITDNPGYVRKILYGHATSEKNVVCYR